MARRNPPEKSNPTNPKQQDPKPQASKSQRQAKKQKKVGRRGK